MKIEKVNDHQIRCTLTKADLADRELKISELAYGTEKAKSLFRDMMQQASYEFGFDAEDIPLMIEAIPLNSECIVLVITKVEDPEELDTRFSKFAPSVHEEDYDEEEYEEEYPGTDLSNTLADNLLRCLPAGVSDLYGTISKMLSEFRNNIAAQTDDGNVVEVSQNTGIKFDLTRVYSFNNLNQVTKLAHILEPHYHGVNSLYRNDKNSGYILVISQTEHSPEEFNKICNVISEYGNPEKFDAASEAYMEEHFELVIKDKAIQSLSLV